MEHLSELLFKNLWNRCILIVTSSWTLRLWGCEEWIFNKLIWEFWCTWNLRTASTEIWKICPQKSPPPIRIDDRRKVGRPHSASIGGVLAPSQILSTLLFCFFKKKLRASLVVQWWRIPIVMQGTQVRSLAREDPTHLRAAMPTGHNYWAHVL